MKEWKEVAYKRVASQLIVNEMARVEKIEVSKDEIEAELLKIMTQVPDTDENQARSYVTQILTNEKVMQIIDGSKK